jgi:hypothetical protein
MWRGMWHRSTAYKSLSELILCAVIAPVKRNDGRLFPCTEKEARKKCRSSIPLDPKTNSKLRR